MPTYLPIPWKPESERGNKDIFNVGLMYMLYNWNSKSTGDRDSILLTLTSLAHCKMTGGPTIQASPLCNLWKTAPSKFSNIKTVSNSDASCT